jgi:hypothetical protein
VPASGKKDEMSETELQQRSDAGQKSTDHGVYAFRDRGEAALTDTGRSRLAVLQEQVGERSTAIELLKEFTAKSVLIAELAMGYVSTKRSEGVELDKLAVFRALPAFLNTAARTLKDLIALLPNDKDILDEEAILQSLKDKAVRDGSTSEPGDPGPQGV